MDGRKETGVCCTVQRFFVRSTLDLTTGVTYRVSGRVKNVRYPTGEDQGYVQRAPTKSQRENDIEWK